MESTCLSPAITPADLPIPPGLLRLPLHFPSTSLPGTAGPRVWPVTLGTLPDTDMCSVASQTPRIPTSMSMDLEQPPAAAFREKPTRPTMTVPKPAPTPVQDLLIPLPPCDAKAPEARYRVEDPSPPTTTASSSNPPLTASPPLGWCQQVLSPRLHLDEAPGPRGCPPRSAWRIQHDPRHPTAAAGREPPATMTSTASHGTHGVQSPGALPSFPLPSNVSVYHKFFCRMLCCLVDPA